ncbi:MAG: grasp-with-spasm system SPASM domain peptide maturase [Cyclobacteriaceae bacterium]
MNPNQYFKLFACCIPVKGATKSLLCDLQRNSYCEIPNSLYTILTDFQKNTFGELVAQFDDEETLLEYFNFLVSNEFGFFTTKPDLFPELTREWYHPSVITNAIVDTDDRSRHDYLRIFENLDKVGCVDLQMRFFGRGISNEELDKLLRLLSGSSIATVELILPFSDSFSEEAIKEICHQHQRVGKITFYRAPEEKFTKVYGGDPSHLFAQIFFTKQVIDSHAHCGQIDPWYFILSTKGFMESQQHNSCLNRKVGISPDGEIRNCPSLPDAYGNINEISILEAISKKDFTKLWFIHKDEINVCMDCEFRHMCTDCRAFLSDPEDLYSKPAKCGYDPYKGVWTAENDLQKTLTEKAITASDR